jgi:uncharacterized protein (TIGR04255 family)
LAGEGEFVSPFPQSPRVVYSQNPLELVICQLRFPPILRIGAEPPATFQDMVRDEYPLLKESSGPQLPNDLPAELRDVVQRLTPQPSGIAYDFASADEQWAISLNRDFIALTARTYTRWEEFSERLALPIQALRDAYGPAFVTRIGLRYQDVICLSRLGKIGESWSQLLQPHIAGELAEPSVAQSAQQASRELLLDLGGDDRVRIRHGLAKRSDSGETCYLIDADFFSEGRTNLDDVLARLRTYNKHAGRLFRWCITDELHEALGPTPI